MKQQQTKFVIISMARCGTTFLVDLLNSHPNIYCDGGILKNRDPATSLKSFFELHLANASVRASGFKLMGQQNSHLLESVIQNPEIKKIILRRKNHVRHFYSLTMARSCSVYHLRPFTQTIQRRWTSIQRNFWLGKYRSFAASVKNLLLTLLFFRQYTTSYSPRLLHLNPEELSRFMAQKEEYFATLKDSLARHGQSWLEVCYEDLVDGDFLSECARILDFICVSTCRLSASTKRLHGTPLPDLIANYEQIKQYCRDRGIAFE